MANRNSTLVIMIIGSFSVCGDKDGEILFQNCLENWILHERQDRKIKRVKGMTYKVLIIILLMIIIMRTKKLS